MSAINSKNCIPFIEEVSSSSLTIPKVGVYRNLHNGAFSVIDAKHRRVLFHTNKIILSNVKFHVRIGGWKSVYESGVKTVHAFVYGTISEETLEESDLCVVTYRPKISPYFFCPSLSEDPEKSKIFTSNYAILKNGNTILAKI